MHELVSILRARASGLKVLHTTGNARNARVNNGALDPGPALLIKPFTLDDPALRLRALLERDPLRR